MIIQGSVNSNKNKILIDKYGELISNGVHPKEILVILLNPFKKNLFIKELNKNNINIDNAKIFTLNGLYYNAFKDNTDYIKTLLKSGNNLNQCGLEVSQYIFKECIKEVDFNDYISKVNLLHQLFRRYSLIVQNCLSDKEVEARSKMLNETFAPDAFEAIKKYKQKTIELSSFDYLRQAAIFPLIYKNTKYFKDIKYLIVDNTDEMPFIFWQFTDYLMPQLKDYIISYDKNGSSRCGYLCAYKSGIEEFKKKYKPETMILPGNSPFSDLAEDLFESIKKSEKLHLKRINYKNYVNRLEMLDCVFSHIQNLISSGVKPEEISIITPVCDDLIHKYINNTNTNLNFNIISGSEKLSDIDGIKQIISVLKLVNNIEVNDYEIKSLFISLIKMPFRKCIHLIKDLKDFKFNQTESNEKYIKLINVLKSLRNTKYKLTEQIKIIYENVIKDSVSEELFQKYDFFLKEALNFEQTFSFDEEKIIEEFIIQIENSVISENPANSFNLNNNTIIISTPQKIIDYEIKTKHQFWLDISSSEWFKQDTGTLYNAWVLNRDWTKDSYSFEDSVMLEEDKAARCLRKLMLLSQKEIYFYSSLYDSRGNENFGGLSEYLISSQNNQNKIEIVPRDDQKPVLEYKNGKMGIMAVPGAGKTTILLALITKLIEKGINPENIFVLTYMESAAKNFKERIKLNLSDNNAIPNISTIHGLALRIIKENGNYSSVGLDEDFEICDDSEKERIIKELFYKLKIPDEKYDNYLRSISIVKLSENKEKLTSKYQEIQEFYNFLDEYNKKLKEKNLIDYDDMLRFALMILRENKEAANYYQNLCRYIIEDEAQDSTQVQQKLIEILSSKYKNVIRCGDINQSITSTFTNSDLENFRCFISNNNKVEMVSSQRCAEPIYNLANKLIKTSINDNEKNRAFYNINIKGTDKNPKISEYPSYKIFETDKEEKQFIIEKIKEIKKISEDASIAILLRLNIQVNEYNECLLNNGIKTIIRTDSLSQKDIYKYIFAVLKICQNPLNNTFIKELGLLYTRNEEEKEFIKNYFNDLKEPFINIEADEINSETLCQLYWDVNYFLDNSDSPLNETALMTGLFYSKNSVDKSNTYLISTFIKRLNSDIKNEQELLKNLEYYSNKSMSTYKFFDEAERNKQNAINIMTMHKAKGDEFDYVFIPMLSEENYPTEISTVKLKSGGHFVETIKHNVTGNDTKKPEELKKEQIEENLRLLYVGITRAKKGLYMTCSNRYLTRKNIKTSSFIEKIL